MVKAPSTTTAAIMLAVFLCLGSAKSFAQCVSGVDYDCSGSYSDCGHVTTGCTQSSVFQVNFSGTFTMGARIVNCTNACDCSSCVFVEKVASGSIIDSVESGCSVQICSNTMTLWLDTGYDYRLYVCKRPCDDEHDYSDCDEACKAEGWLVSNPGPNCP